MLFKGGEKHIRKPKQKKLETKEVILNLRITKEEKEKLEAIASKLNIKPTTILRTALNNLLDPFSSHLVKKKPRKTKPKKTKAEEDIKK